MELYQIRSPDNPSDFQVDCLLAICTLINIKHGEKIYIEDGISYSFDFN